MATQLTLVNNVLRRLREDEVASVADNAYAQLIAMWLNDGIREVNDAYAWRALSHELNITIDVGVTEYDLGTNEMGGGDVPDSERVTTHESILEFDGHNRPLANMFDDASDTYSKARMILMSEEARYRRQQWDRIQENIRPNWFSLSVNEAGTGMVMTLWPIPNKSNHLRVAFHTPQTELAIDGSDDATNVIIPRAPVEAYVNMIAANERGEEIGEPGNLLERRYMNVLGAAIEVEAHQDIRLNLWESSRD